MLRNLIYEATEKVSVGIFGPLYQRVGRRLIARGLEIQGSPYYDDRRNIA
jgi:hypothetical protein